MSRGFESHRLRQKQHPAGHCFLFLRQTMQGLQGGIRTARARRFASRRAKMPRWGIFRARVLYFSRTVCYGITVHGLPTIFMAIPHNSKCRYGERGATAAKPKAQIILDAAKVSAASGGNSEPKQGQRSQSARGFCPRSTMRVPQPDIIEHFGNADAVPQPPERCLSSQAGIVRCCLKNRRMIV